MRIWKLSLFAGILFCLFCQVGICIAGLGPALDGRADFRALYAAGHIVRTGNSARLYEYDFEKRVQSAVVTPRTGALPFVYPPYASLIFVPLSLLSYKSAYFLFFGINLLLAALAATIIRPYMMRVRGFLRMMPYALFLCFFPVAIALMQGQVSLLLLVLYCTCYAALQRGKPFVAGLVLAIALLKFQIALPIVLLFLVWRQWRFLGGFLTGAGLVTILSVSVVGLRGIESYCQSILAMASAVSAGSEKLKYGMFPEAMPNLHGLFYKISGGASWGFELTMISSLFLLLWAMSRKPSLPLALLTGMLVSYHLQPHDLSLLLLPVSLGIEATFSGSFPTEIYLMNDVSLRAKQRSPKGFWATALLGGLLLFPPLPLVLIGAGWTSALAIPVVLVLFWTSRLPHLFAENRSLAGVQST